MTWPRIKTRYHGVAWDAMRSDGTTRKEPWRVRFYWNRREVVLKRFASEEDAARFSDVARTLLKPGSKLNLDGQPPAGWTYESVLRYLVERGIVGILDLRRILAPRPGGVEISETGEILPPANLRATP